MQSPYEQDYRTDVPWTHEEYFMYPSDTNCDTTYRITAAGHKNKQRRNNQQISTVDPYYKCPISEQQLYSTYSVPHKLNSLDHPQRRISRNFKHIQNEPFQNNNETTCIPSSTELMQRPTHWTTFEICLVFLAVVIVSLLYKVVNTLDMLIILRQIHN